MKNIHDPGHGFISKENFLILALGYTSVKNIS